MLQILSRLFHFVQSVKCKRISLEMNCSGSYPRFREKNENHRRVLTSSIKREIREFYVVVVKSNGKEMYRKKYAAREACFAF